MSSFRSFTACTAIVSAFAISSAAHAQAAYDFDLPSQSLETSLQRVGSRTGTSILFDTRIVKGKVAPALQGKYSADAAVRALLRGSGLSMRKRGGGTIIISGDRAEVESPAPPTDVRGDDAPPESETIIVTGSRIRQAQASASPAYRIDREDIVASGATNAQDLLRKLPQNFTGGPSATSAAVSSQRNGAAFSITFGSGANLRGLGSESTLVLLDGRRIAPGGLGSFTDLSSIPLSALERVDVVPDGASAVYGSEAVGGVINFILRDSYEGAETRVRYGGVTDGNMRQFNASQLFGANWGEGGVLLNLNYDRDKPLLATDRDYASALHAGLSYLSLNEERYGALLKAHQQLSPELRLSATLYGNIRKPDVETYQARAFRQISSNGRLGAYGGTLALDWKASDSWTISVAQTQSYNESIRRNNIGASPTVPASFTSIRGNTRFTTTELEAEGSIFSLPGGDARLAIGGERRTERLKVERVNFAGPRSLLARNIHAGYAELYFPLVGAENRTSLFEALSLTAAARYEDYNDVGAADTYKLGALWSPVRGLTLRGTWGTSFRAPFLYQYDSSANAGVIYDIPNAGGTTRIAVLSQAPHPDLGPERAKTWTAGFDVDPSILGARLSFTYYGIDYRDRIQAPGFRTTAFSTPVLMPFISIPPDPAILAIIPTAAQYANLTPGDISTVQATFDGRIQNIARVRTSGIDIGVDADFETGAGTFDLGLNLNYILDFKTKQTEIAPTVDIVDTIFNPADLRIRANVGWRHAGWSASAFLNYTDSYTDNQLPAAPVGVSSWTTVDFNLAYSFQQNRGPLKGVSLRFNASNIFDKDPPAIIDRGAAFGSPGYDTENATPFGRILSLELSKAW